MVVLKDKTNLICRQILDTKEVLEGQIVAVVLNNNAVKGLSLEEKKQLSLQIKASLITQFDNLVDRTQKVLS